MCKLKFFASLIILLLSVLPGCREKAPQKASPPPQETQPPKPYVNLLINSDLNECKSKLSKLKTHFKISDQDKMSNGFLLSVFVLGKLMPEECLDAFQNPSDLK